MDWRRTPYFSTQKLAIPCHRLTQLKTALWFVYGHFFIFAAAGAFSAGVVVMLDLGQGSSQLNKFTAAATLTVPVAAFVLGVWLLVPRHHLSAATNVLVPCLGILIRATAFTPWPAVCAALLMVVLVVLIESAGVREPKREKI